ncbi:predicted protein [Histoplasma capsulatum H143]|uniref:Uncharacterized protein n=1 Tax=Ajellomyces capsulatus (strain H143) TaxID=544712 RepID=C6H4A1_AJECH|nr:predicted protein [Histoplasma capsulatum H143]
MTVEREEEKTTAGDEYKPTEHGDDGGDEDDEDDEDDEARALVGCGRPSFGGSPSIDAGVLKIEQERGKEGKKECRGERGKGQRRNGTHRTHHLRPPSALPAFGLVPLGVDALVGRPLWLIPAPASPAGFLQPHAPEGGGALAGHWPAPYWLEGAYVRSVYAGSGATPAPRQLVGRSTGSSPLG